MLKYEVSVKTEVTTLYNLVTLDKGDEQLS